MDNLLILFLFIDALRSETCNVYFMMIILYYYYYYLKKKHTHTQGRGKMILT